MGMEFNDLTAEDLCDLMCGKIEYDDNDFYITNVNHDINLSHYLHIEECCIGLMMFDGSVYKYLDALEDENFDWYSVQEQFAIMKVDDLNSLLNLMYSWDKEIIIGKPNDWDGIQIPHITIYDGWIE